MRIGTMWMKKVLLATATAGLISGCFAPRRRVLFVYRPPPPEAVEAIPPSPGDGYVWIRGHYRWDVVAGRYRWLPGHWQLLPRGYHEWVVGHWVERPDGAWLWVEGHWR